MRRVGGHVSCAGGLLKAVDNALAIGANCLQIFAGSPRMWARSLYPAASAQAFREAVKSHDLSPVYIHALYLTNLASDNQELLGKSSSALIADLTNCAAIGSAGVILHIGSHQGRGWPSVRDQVISEIRTVLATTPNSSTLILENTAGQNGKIGSFFELSEILAAIRSPRLKVCLDTAHAFEAGYNFTNPQGLSMLLTDLDKFSLLPQLELLHLNDSKSPSGSGRDLHGNIGDGYIGHDALMQLINDPKLLHLPLILEVPGIEGTGPDKENLNRVKELLK